jgi:hypothetical protein
MKLWDRLPSETDPAWRAFEAYRDLPPSDRSIAAAVKATGVKPGNNRNYERWSSRHDWVSRARAWDTRVDQEVQRRLMKERGDRAVEQAKLGRNLQAVAGMGISNLIKEVQDARAPGGHRRVLKRDLKPSEIAQLAKAGVEIERVAEGDPTERLALSGPDGGGLEVRIVDVRGLPDPRRREVERA